MATTIKSIKTFASAFDPLGFVALWVAFEKDTCPIQYSDKFFEPE